LLARLRPSIRMAWLCWACRESVRCGSKIEPGVSPHSSGLAMEVYFDFWLLVANYRLDPEKALACLVDVAKGKLDAIAH
jgi:hypothetical protein